MTDSEALDARRSAGRNAELAAVSDATSDVKAYRLSAARTHSDHALVLDDLPTEGGIATAAFEVRGENAWKFRLQFVAGSGDGAYGVFDLENAAVTVGRLAEARQIAAGLERLQGGWSRIWLRAAFPRRSGKGAVSLSLADAQGQYTFKSRGELILLRRLQIVRGTELPPYKAAPHDEASADRARGN